MLCCFAGIDHVNNCIWYLVILALVLPPLRLLHICCPHPVLCVLLVQLMSGAVFCSSCSAPRVLLLVFCSSCSAPRVLLLVQLMSGAVLFLLSKISGHTGTRTASRSCVLI